MACPYAVHRHANGPAIRFFVNYSKFRRIANQMVQGFLFVIHTFYIKANHTIRVTFLLTVSQLALFFVSSSCPLFVSAQYPFANMFVVSGPDRSNVLLLDHRLTKLTVCSMSPISV